MDVAGSLGQGCRPSTRTATRRYRYHQRLRQDQELRQRRWGDEKPERVRRPGICRGELAVCFLGGHIIKGAVERHHLICRRYFRQGEDDKTNNLVPVCHEHHAAFHRSYDCQRWRLSQYLTFMCAINFGCGIYAPSNEGVYFLSVIWENRCINVVTTYAIPTFEYSWLLVVTGASFLYVENNHNP